MTRAGRRVTPGEPAALASAGAPRDAHCAMTAGSVTSVRGYRAARMSRPNAIGVSSNMRVAISDMMNI